MTQSPSCNFFPRDFWRSRPRIITFARRAADDGGCRDRDVHLARASARNASVNIGGTRGLLSSERNRLISGKNYFLLQQFLSRSRAAEPLVQHKRRHCELLAFPQERDQPFT